MELALPILAMAGLAAATPLLSRRWPHHGGLLLALLVAVAGGELLAAGGPERVEWVVPWLPQLGISFALRLDGLSLVFAALAIGIGALVALYAWRYLEEEPERGRCVALLVAFMAAMLGLVLADDLFVLYVFWELTSICSWLLIAFHHDRPAARSAAWQALLVTTGGGLAMLAGFVLLADAAGTSRISEIVGAAARLEEHPLLPWASALVLAGIATKSAQVPFHGWLPRAMEAPTPASAYLHAATMVKAGIYLALRILPVLGASAVFRWGLLAVGLASFLLGGVRALLLETDLKKILAHSTVSALGFLLLLTGVGTTAAVHAALAYTVAHALYKGALFLAAGAFDHGAGTRDADRLTGVWGAMPISAACAAAAALSMAGVPGLFGYVSKEAAYLGLLGAGGGAWLTAVAVGGNALLVAVAGVAGLFPAALRRRPAPPGTHEVPLAMWAPVLALATAGVALGVAPAAADALLAPIAAALVPGPTAPLSALHGGATAALSALTIGLGVALVLGRPALRRALAPAAAPSVRDGFGAFLRGLDAVCRRHTAMLQTDSLPRDLFVTFGAATALVVAAFVRGGMPLAARGGGPELPELVLGAVAVAATLAAARSRSRLAAIVALGAVGYAVGLLFLRFGAPDLAMTQIAVETVTVMVLLLAFRHLPRFGRDAPRRDRLRDLGLATAVGAVMAAFVLSTSAGARPEPVSAYFLARSVPEAHGRNVVNTTLVDFRGLDTLGETAVIAIAGFGVIALLRLRAPKGRP